MAESIGTVELGIRVDDDQANRDLQQFGRNAQKAGGDAANAFKDLDRRLGLSTTAVSSLSAALGTLAVGEFLRQSVQAAIELETVTRKLSNTLGEQGAAGALTFTRGLADELGLSFRTLSQTFSSFTAAATAANVPIEVQRDLFSAVSTAAQQLGLSNDELSGSLLALQQVASKGTVQMEELRGQLGERLPVAFSAAAKGLGLTQQELIKLVETGQLTADRFFPALAKGLNELTASTDGMPTAAQNIAKFQNAIDDLKISTGEGLLPFLNDAVVKLNEFVKLANSQEFARGLSLNPDKVSVNKGGILASLPEQTQKAVDGARELQREFNLTDRQIQVLFYNAARSVGVTNNAFGQLQVGAGEVEKILQRLPGLAQQFRDKYPDRQSQLQAENAQAAALLTQQTKSIASIDNLNAKLKAQRDELNKLEIGSAAFVRKSEEVKALEQQLKSATGQIATLKGQIDSVDVSRFSFRSLDLDAGKARLDFLTQSSQAENDLINARLEGESRILRAREEQATKVARTEEERNRIAADFAVKQQELDQRRNLQQQIAIAGEFGLRKQIAQFENQQSSLKLQQEQLRADALLRQAQAANDPEGIRAAKSQLDLINKQIKVQDEINNLRIRGIEQAGALQLQKLQEEAQVSQEVFNIRNRRTNEPTVPDLIRQGRLIPDINGRPLANVNDQDSLNRLADQYERSTGTLSGRLESFSSQIEALANKDWTVQVEVVNQAGGGTTINSYSGLQ